MVHSSRPRQLVSSGLLGFTLALAPCLPVLAVEEVVVAADAPVASPTAADLPPVVEVVSETPAANAPDPELEAMRKERDKVSAENSLAQERLRRELFSLDSERQRLSLQNSLRSERLNADVAELRTRIDRISLETEAVAKQAAFDAAQRREAIERELAELRAEEERLKVANSIAAQRIEGRMVEMRLQESEFKIQKAELEMEVGRLQTELTRREKSEILRDLVPETREYPLEPFKDGVLLVSDRRIALNGVVVPLLADLVAERIDYFNNQSTEHPIFIVIDSSPGGSVMAGYKILKAMDGSQAPVYVVVKSYAASMAAVITTLAKRSFVYPNTLILHHQIAWMGGGNLTQQREMLDDANQWWRRLSAPVAAKAGLSLDEFIKRMYERNSDGNWREFGDTAKKLGWVSEVVDTIWETSMDKNPDRFGTRPVLRMELAEKVDEEGNPYVVVPRLAPLDYYHLHNPDRYYRLR